MKKHFITLSLCALSTLSVKGQSNPNFSPKQNLEDFEYALKQLEQSYSGFDIYVNDITKFEYDSLVYSLRNEIITCNRPGWDASNQLYSWFDDSHLGLVLPYEHAIKYSSDRRKYHNYPEIRPYAPALVACEVDPDSYLIRIPEFDGEAVTHEWIDSVINVFDQGTYPNLIIDLRGNEGGDERLWDPLLSVIFEHSGTVKSVEFKKSDENIAFLESIKEDFPEAHIILEKIAESPDLTYVPLTETDDYHIEVLPYSGHKPQKVAFIIDANVASAAEGLLIQAKAVKDNVIIYGQDSTSGTLDCASVRVDCALPNSRIALSIPISRTCGLPQSGIDKTGILPDKIIPISYPKTLTTNVDEWVQYIATDLK